MAEKIHTIRDTEQRLRTLVWGAVAAATVLDVALIVTSWPLSPVDWIATATSFALLILCASRIIRDRTSVGMIPVAIFSLGFAGLAAHNVITAIFGLATLTFFLMWFIALWRAYAQEEPIEDDAALVVLGCAVHNGEVGGTLERRLQKAHELLIEEPSRICVVTGGPVPGGSTEAEAMATWLTEHGIGSSRIILENEALNTEENLAYSWALLDAHKHTGQRCIVSSDFHLWRVRAIAHRMQLVPEPVLVPAQTPAQGWLVQWCREVLVVLDWLRKGE